MEDDLYRVLGVAHDADDAVIRAAYRALSQRHHPDRAPPGHRDASHERMAAINAAYAVLGDPERRRAYDAQLSGRTRTTVRPATSTASRCAGAEGGRRHRIARSVAQAAIVMASVVLACVLAVEEKGWWRWAWDWLGSGFGDTSRYAVDWATLLFVVGLGVDGAWRVGRGGRQ